VGRVEGKVCLVTGAAAGLGRADAERLIGEGAVVVLTDIDPDGEGVAKSLGDRASFMQHDVSQESEWVRVIGTVQERHGRLDVLVNNAGLVEPADVEECTEASWRRHMSVMVDGTFFGCKHAIPLMRASGGGSIINMASTASKVGIPGIPAYCAAKGAIASLTRSVAVHCINQGYEIRCNSVHPTNTDTPMLRRALGDAVVKTNAMEDGTPITRISKAIDVAHLVLYLASDESLMATGAEFWLDRGVTIMEGVSP
jgi:3(or 17)beta-hydroxysteroid dehydrogenase